MKLLSLRVLRELVKARPPGITMFTENLTKSVLKCFKETECNISQVSEDLFSPLAGALPPQRVLNVLSPEITGGTGTINLGALKLFSKVSFLYMIVCRICACTKQFFDLFIVLYM